MLLTEKELSALRKSDDPNVKALLKYFDDKINGLEVEVQQEQGDREYYEDKAFQLQIKLDRTENTVYELHDKLESFNLLDSTTLPYTSMYEVLSKKLQKYSPQQIENLLTNNLK